MTINQIECFIYSAREGSFSKAAAQLFVSQQSISHQIRGLEKELGFPVFERHNLGVRLTEHGKLLYDVWEPFLMEHRTAIDRALDMFHEGDRIVRIGFTDLGAMTDELCELLLQYNENNPELDLQYTISNIPQILDMIHDGRMQMFVAPTSELERLHDIKKIPLSQTSMRVGIYLSKYHPLARRKSLDIGDLVGQKIGVLSKDVSLDYVDNVQVTLERTGMIDQVEVVPYSSRRNMELALVSQKCITLTYEMMFTNLTERLKFYPIDWLTMEDGISLCWKDEKYDIKARNMADHIMKGEYFK